MLRNDAEAVPQSLTLDFHPARLEQAQRMPSPIGRILLWSICLFALLPLIWTTVGTVDVVAVGQGKIIPTGRVQVVQAPEGGVVRAIHVRDGDKIAAGDTLLELDQTAVLASYDQVRDDFRHAQLERARLAALAENPRNPEAHFVVPAAVRQEVVAGQRRLMLGRAAEYRAQMEVAQADALRRHSEARSLQTQILKLEASIPLLTRRVEAKQTLTDKGFGATMPLLEIRQQLSDQEHDLLILKARMAEAQNGIQSADAQVRRVRAEFNRGVEADLADVERKLIGLQQDMLKAEQRLHYHTLTAPAAGTVQQMAVNTVGGVLTQGQTVLVVVPAETRLEVEAMILNKDIGFVQPGQPAIVKFETFNFTRYGYLEGTVLHVSRDAIEDKAFGLVYAARISLPAQSMAIDGRAIPLSAGMTATVEIKTDRRSIIDFVIAPLIRYKHEGLRER